MPLVYMSKNVSLQKQATLLTPASLLTALTPLRCNPSDGHTYSLTRKPRGIPIMYVQAGSALLGPRGHANRAAGVGGYTHRVCTYNLYTVCVRGRVY